MADLVPASDGSDPVRVIHLAAKLSIGQKRNFGCERAQGALIAHWDDDDWSHPDRLTQQVAHLAASGQAVTGYRSLPFTDGTQWWRYTGAPDYVLGTSLLYRRSWWAAHRFANVQVGEDSAFGEVAAKARELAVSDEPNLMYATIHPGNTSPRQMQNSRRWTRLDRSPWAA